MTPAVLKALIVFHLRDAQLRLGLDVDEAFAHARQQCAVADDAFDDAVGAMILRGLRARRLDL